MPRRRKIAAIAAVPVVLGLLAIGPGQDYARGAVFVIQAAGMEGPARTVAEWNTDAITESDAEIPWRGGSLRGRTYRPADAETSRPDPVSDLGAPPVLLVPGVHAGGIDEPRLVQFARDVASMGRIAVTAELPDLKQYSITTRTTDMIEDAAIWLSSRSGFAPDGRIGMVGISFGHQLRGGSVDRRRVAGAAARSRRVRAVVRRARRPAADAEVSLHR
jgi:hypothetical protein